MILSRTSRILIGFLLLALAAFLWANFLVNGSGFETAMLRAAPSPSAGSADGGEGEGDDLPSVAPVPRDRVARELEVLDLPFLVTEPPAEPEPEEERQAGQTGAAGVSARRATINPFSPILQPPSAQAAEPAPAPAQQQERPITEVPIPSAPLRTSPPAAAAAPKPPAPAPVAPPAQQAGDTLPRALPRGTLGGTPDLLRSAIGAGGAPPVRNLAEVAVVREPEDPLAEPPLREGERPSEPVEVAEGEPRPLQRPLAGAEEGGRDDREPGAAPLQAGTSALSRYLRDNDVRFTGSVIGPVSVGVFRSAMTAAPVVISLGQTLPETSIVLTELRGQQAELTLADDSQILTLELRR